MFRTTLRVFVDPESQPLPALVDLRAHSILTLQIAVLDKKEEIQKTWPMAVIQVVEVITYSRASPLEHDMIAEVAK